MDKAHARKKSIFQTLDTFDSGEEEPFEETIYQRKLRIVQPEPIIGSKKTSGRSENTHSNRDIERVASSANSIRTRLSKSPTTHGQPRRLIRRATEPTNAKVIIVDDDDIIEGPAVARLPGLKHSVSSPPTSSTRIPPLVGAIPKPLTAARKRKREHIIQQVPENERYFKDCVFYFFPASDIDKTRRFLITKAISHGAIWAKEWHPSVTHIIMDTGLSKDDLFKHTPLTETPTNAVAVDRTYLSSCLENRALLNPSYYQSLVPGFESIPEESSPLKHCFTTSVQERDTSLSVKPAKSNGMIGNELIQEATLSRNEDASDDLRSHSSAFRRLPATTQEVSTGDTCLDPLDSNLDALDKAIAEAKGTAALLIDSDNESNSRPTSSRSAVSDEEDERPLPSSRPGSSSSTKSPSVPAWQKHFTCMQPAASKDNDNATNPNAPVIALLDQMASYYDNTHDQWRTRAYRIAISALKKHPHEVTTAAQASQIRGIGARLAAKIEEIKWTSRLRRLENTLLEPSDKALKLFLGIYGVGPALAGTWVQRGYRSLADIEKHVTNLTPNQRVGIEHYADFATRIPRDEVAAHGVLVSDAIRAIDPTFEVIVGGSYRRGAATSGDIDILISHPTNSISYTRTLVLDTLIPRLTSAGYLVAALAATDRSDGSKWHGACQLPASSPASDASSLLQGNNQKQDPARSSPASTSVPPPHNPWRRIDLLLVPSTELGAALLYFTGNDIFNRSMRLLARKKGMRLNQRGLFKDVMRAGQVKLNEGTKVAGEREEDIFRVLGVPWRGLGERDC